MTKKYNYVYHIYIYLYVITIYHKYYRFHTGPNWDCKMAPEIFLKSAHGQLIAKKDMGRENLMNFLDRGRRTENFFKWSTNTFQK